MPTTDSDPKKRSLPALIFQNHFEITYRVILLTLIPLAILASGGYLVDKHFKIAPLGLATGIILAFVLSMYMVYITFTSMTRSNDK